MAAAWQAPLAMSLAVMFSPSARAIKLGSNNATDLASKALRTTAHEAGITCGQLSTFAENNFNNRGDTNIPWIWTYTETLANGFPVALSGWTNTRGYARGYVTNTPNTDPKAVVSGLQPGGTYAYKVYQYAEPNYAGTNTLSVNGGASVDTYSSMSTEATAEGQTTATGLGEITFSFTRVAYHLHLSGLAISSCQVPTTPSPTPTTATTSTGGAHGTGGTGGASAQGHPHLQNVHGQRFDLMKPGNHVLINIPKGERAADAMLRVEAKARRLGGCSDMYFQALNITGSWAEQQQAGGYHYSISQPAVEHPEWIAFYLVELKVVHGHTQRGIRYLNFYVKHLGRTGFAVGGLLGDDDHTDASTVPASCHKRVALVRVRP